MDDPREPTLEVGPEVVTDEPVFEPEEGQVEAQTAEADAPDGEEGEEAKKTAAKARRDRQKAHVARLQQEREAAERKAQEAEDRARKLESLVSKRSPPSEADFPDPIEHAAMMAVWRHSQAQATETAEQVGSEVKAAQLEADRIEQERRRAVAGIWTENVAEARTRYADFDAVALNTSVPVSEFVAGLLQESDVGPDVAYYLGKNVKLAAAISSASPIEAARAIGRLEAEIAKTRAKPVTNAPPPVSPIRGGGASTGKDPGKMTGAEYQVWRLAGGKL